MASAPAAARAGSVPAASTCAAVYPRASGPPSCGAAPLARSAPMTTLAAAELRDLLAEATAMVGRSSALVRERLRGDVAFRRKADRTLVSAIDLEVEATLRAELARRFPA